MFRNRITLRPRPIANRLCAYRLVRPPIRWNGSAHTPSEKKHSPKQSPDQSQHSSPKNPPIEKKTPNESKEPETTQKPNQENVDHKEDSSVSQSTVPPSTQDATATIELPETTEFELANQDFQRYYHYFDTHKIYSGLKYSGFNEGQADVLMLTIRDMLSRKLAECKESHPLVSQAENDAYLFEAACSEIRNEIQTARQVQNEEYRSNQARLQRDVEILQQEENEIIGTLKSEIEMDINERKNTTKADESMVDMNIQVLNNKIAIDLTSEVKSKIEALRWQTTRRGLIAVLAVAFGIMMATSATKKEEPRPKRREPPVSGGEEYQVPILTTSETDDGVEDPPIERLGSRA